MKLTLTTMLLLIVAIINFPILAGEIPSPKQSVISENTVKSVLTGINSNNNGLISSAAYLAGELEIDEAVIPLMKILKDNNNDEELRIVAALSLYKIGDARGIYAIKQAIRFDESKRVSKLCSKFYYTYKHNEDSNYVEIAGL